MKTYYAQEYENEVLAFTSKKARDTFAKLSIYVNVISAKEAYKIVPELRRQCPLLCKQVTFFHADEAGQTLPILGVLVAILIAALYLVASGGLMNTSLASLLGF